MRLFIAEKPSVAKAIATELGITGKGDGYIECGSNFVTWCFGHMLEQAEPDEYTADDIPRTKSGKKRWRVEDLPIIPTTWILKPKDNARKQLGIIGNLLKKADEAVNAGDPDREGCLLVDEVLEHFHYKKPVYRFWVGAQDSVSIQRGLASLKKNIEYQGWSNAARGRSRADWLIGMNLSRAYTLSAQRNGAQDTLPVGRVQTPTLAVVVNRDREIENFKPESYHVIKITVHHDNGDFIATWKAKEDQTGLDSSGRLCDTNIANALVANTKGQRGIIASYKQEAKKKNHPLAFSLSTLTAMASARYGFSAEEVLNVCQSLYETHKLTSYPRTDCSYLPEAQFADAPRVLEAVRHVNPDMAALVDGADLSIRSRTWDDSKITAHHGIVPTMQKGNKDALTNREQLIYEMIVRVYLAQFYPVHEYMQTTVDVTVANERFVATGRVITRNGWRDVFDQNDDANENESDKLPSPMNQGDHVQCTDATRHDMKTKPPEYFTEGTLIMAMENIHKYVNDLEHKKMLREGDGIGTSATRASIISELKRRKFLDTKGKHLISTQLGRSIIDAMPEVMRNPTLTALYERMLKGIEQGTETLEQFIIKQETFIRDEVSNANKSIISIVGGKTAAPPAPASNYKCQACGSSLTRRPSKKNKNVFWWGCSSYPKCDQTYFDNNGQPNYNSKSSKSTNIKIKVNEK